jgi:organic radical activating enzyme
MIRLPELTIYISHTCDLACKNCFTYNNLNWAGHFDINKEVEILKDQVTFDEVFLIGGEPTLHPKLKEWMQWVEFMWPDSYRWIVTNGRHLNNLPDNWMELWKIEISAHSPKDLQSIIEWLDGNGITYTKYKDTRHTDADTHYVLYHKGKEVGQLSEAWNFFELPMIAKEGKSLTWKYLEVASEQHSICPAKACMHLVDGRFYRCQQQALLPRLSKQFQIKDPYKKIAEQDVGCSPLEFHQWIITKDSPQEQCRLCNWNKKVKLPAESEIKKIKVLKL